MKKSHQFGVFLSLVCSIFTSTSSYAYQVAVTGQVLGLGDPNVDQFNYIYNDTITSFAYDSGFISATKLEFSGECSSGGSQAFAVRI